MSQMKTRLQALSLLDRAVASMSDDELTALVDSLPADHRASIDELCGADDGFSDPAARALAIRATAARGRLNGDLERLATIMSDPCLARCIDDLGDDADNPTEEQLLAVAPGLVDDFGVATVRLMFATSVAGEATAAPVLVRLLKQHDTLALPPAAPVPAPELLPAAAADEATKERRRALKEKKQAEARARREQQQRARHR